MTSLVFLDFRINSLHSPYLTRIIFYIKYVIKSNSNRELYGIVALIIHPDYSNII